MPQSTLTLKPGAIAVYVVLMAENRAIDTMDLATILGVKNVDSDALKQLRDARLVDVGKAGRRNTYRLSATGWDRSLDVMAARPNTTGSMAHALLCLLQGMHRGFIGQATLSPKTFFSALGGDVDPSHLPDTEALVRKAYAQLSRRPGDWVPLADIRDSLSQLGRDALDGALRSLAMQPGVQITPWDNRKALTSRDHDAALRWGGGENHVLRIETV